MNIKCKKAFFVFALSMAVCCGGILNAVAVKKSAAVYMPLNNRIIVIDAGHGGWGPCAIKHNKKEGTAFNKQSLLFIMDKSFK